ncbi:MAG: LysR family transcriptional regulator [Proteobacteria bacterium]|nr:LysR family transcriptional regulator [Pseudomonadota bacterium]
MSINYSALRAFHAVATSGGFTKAAQQLNVTQPTLSSQVAALEARYGVTLFHRRGRRVEATALGRDLLGVTRRLFDLEAEAMDLLAAAQSLTAGHLSLGADSPHHIVEALGAFSRRYPALTVSLTIDNSESVLRDLLDYRIDLAVLADVTPDPRLATRMLRRDPLVIIVPRGHRWARKGSVALRELDGERMVMREAGSVTRAIFERGLARAGVAVKAVMEIDSREAVREAVAAGLGLGVVSAAEFGHDARLKAVPIRGKDLAMTESLVRLAERPPSRPVQALLDLFRENRPAATQVV